MAVYEAAMSGGSTKKTTQENSTTSNTIDPRQLAMLEQNYASAQSHAANLKPYTGSLTAGFNPVQRQAQEMLTGIAGDTGNRASLEAARGNVQALMGYKPGALTAASITPRLVQGQGMSGATVAAAPIAGPQAVTAERINGAQIQGQAPIAADRIAAGQLADTDLSAYMNPDQKAVIDTTLADNERARQIAQQANARKASAAGAFGGSRSAVLDAQTNEAYDRNNASTLANLNAQNFGQAQGAATADINRRLEADQANAGNALTAGQFNANLAQAASLANQQSSNDAARSNAANALGAAQFNAGNDLTAQQFNAGQALQAGLANQQSLNDAARSNAANAQAAALANQNADLTAQQFNAESLRGAQQGDISNALAANGLALNAAGQLIALNNAGLADATSRAGLLGSVGDAQQQLDQAGLDALYQEFQRQQGNELTQQNMLNAALGLIPVQQTTTGSSSGTSTEKSNGGLMGILGGIGALGQGLGAMGVSLL
jgi:hypothetical protein